MPAKKPPQKAVKKPVAKPASAKKAPAKRAVAKKAAAKAPSRASAKGDPDALVAAYIAALPAEQKAIAAAVDETVAKSVPGFRRAIKWGMPFYGVEGRGWFCGFAAFKAHCNLNFLRGASLSPPPPEGGGEEMRRVVYRTMSDVDRKQLTAWVKQAAALPGWGK